MFRRPRGTTQKINWSNTAYFGVLTSSVALYASPGSVRVMYNFGGDQSFFADYTPKRVASPSQRQKKRGGGGDAICSVVTKGLQN